MFRYDELLDRDMRERLPREPCPICRSNQIQLCADYNNPMKDLCKCRECGTTGHRHIWNMPRPVPRPVDAVLKLLKYDIDLPLQLDPVDGKYFVVVGKDTD